MNPKLIVVGTSLGGLQALQTLLSGLPLEFEVPIAIVQHRHKSSDMSLARLLQSSSALPVLEVEDKDPIAPGNVYLAPADYHLLVEHGAFSLSTEDPVNYSRPSIDVLFESSAESYGRDLLGVILTGANEDGARGSRRIKEGGGALIVQQPDTAEAPAMPRAALAAVTADWILPLVEIGPFLMTHCAGGNHSWSLVSR